MTGDDRSLQATLAAAKAASRMDRIEYRDAIADHGAAALPAMREWLADPELAGFAVRVVSKIGQGGARDEAVRVLADARPGASEPVRRDIDTALDSLGVRPTSSGGKPSAPKAPIEIKDSLYETLVDAARQRRVITYSDAAAVVDLSMRNPYHRKLLGQYLGAISEYEVEHGRPMLSAVVVQKGSHRTGTGFDHLGEEIGRKSSFEDDATFEGRELARVWAHWSQPPGSAGSTRTGAPDYRTRYPHEDPPPEALGPCDFATDLGQCQNPGRWDRDGFLSCTTHALARDLKPWPRMG